MEHLLSVAALLAGITTAVFISSISANSALIQYDEKNQVPSSTYNFAPQNNTKGSTLKYLLNLLNKDSTTGGLNNTMKMNPALINNSLAYLLHLGNGTLNATAIADAMRTARGGSYGGGYGGGYGGWGQCCDNGFNPLWLLLRDDHHEPQQQQNSMDDLLPLALLTLLGLALIERMPTQG